MREGYYRNKQDFQDSIQSAPNNEYFIKENVVIHGRPEGIERNIGNIGIDHLQKHEPKLRPGPPTKWHHQSPPEIELESYDVPVERYREIEDRVIPLEKIIQVNMDSVRAWEPKEQIIQEPSITPPEIMTPNLYDTGMHPELYQGELINPVIEIPDIKPPEIGPMDMYMQDYEI